MESNFSLWVYFYSFINFRLLSVSKFSNGQNNFLFVSFKSFFAFSLKNEFLAKTVIPGVRVLSDDTVKKFGSQVAT